jgi:site-specific DNA-methyltransferase (adenine-specific)
MPTDPRPSLSDDREWGPPVPFYDDGRASLYLGDCREWLPRLTSDVLVTDPPFNVGKDYGASTDDLASDEYAELMRAVAELGPARQAWVTPTNRLTLFSQLLGPDARPVVVRRGAKGPKRWGWYDQFDMILVRGKPTRWESNLWDGIRLKGEGYFFREEHYDHPGYTPYALISKLVGLMAEPGQVVIDPFAGTGTTLVAAKSLGCHALGIELEQRWCDIASSRLCQEVLAA